MDGLFFWIVVLAVAAVLLSYPISKVLAHDESDHPQLVDWASTRQVMPAARVRVGCESSTSNCSCCNGGDIVKSKFRLVKGKVHWEDGWEWLNIRTNKWERVPDDVIHWDEPTPDKQAVAFEYPIGSGTLRCFFPPQDGGG